MKDQYGDHEEERTDGGSLEISTRDRQAVLRELFMARLERLVALRSRSAAGLNDSGLRLVAHALYATYHDCVELGVGEEAQRLLETVQDN